MPHTHATLTDALSTNTVAIKAANVAAATTDPAPDVTLSPNSAQGAAGIALTNDVGLQYRANATGAASKFHLVSAATTNATVVKAGAGRLLGWSITNTNAAARKVALHNTAGAPTAGAAVFMALVVPGSGALQHSMAGGIGFSTGIAITTTTGVADNDVAAVALGDLVIELFYA